MQSINLIPQQEVQEQAQGQAVKRTTTISIIVLILVAAIAGLQFYRASTIKNQIKGLDNEINGLRAQISKMSEVEIAARNLDKKYTTLKTIFAGRMYYSALSEEISKRTPAGIILDSMTLQKGDKLNITGHADNYILIAGFTNNLLSTEFQGGDAALKGLFKTVVLNSVNLEKNRNIVRFSINTDLNSDLLKRK